MSLMTEHVKHKEAALSVNRMVEMHSFWGGHTPVTLCKAQTLRNYLVNTGIEPVIRRLRNHIRVEDCLFCG